jgi:tetratricopeptide (TPR) repeat protein
MSPPILDIGRLPILGPHLVGRDAELARLDTAWAEPSIHVICLVAFGGVGKSALVNRWLDGLAAAGWRGVDRVLAWSFYLQGTEGQVASADSFLDHALLFFGDSNRVAGSAHDRWQRLARLVQEQRSLIVLDGVEALQDSAGSLVGRLKDTGLLSLLKNLAAANPGLCVVTTRERLPELDAFPRTAPQENLEELSETSGVKLLELLGVRGRESEMRAAVREAGGHALTLTLLGSYLHRACGGDVRRRREVGLYRADERDGGHAFRVIAAYARWLGEGAGPELAILRLLGLFDHPADAASLAVLRAEPPIQGITDRLFRREHWWSRQRLPLPDEDWKWAVSRLRDHGLLAAEDRRSPESLDTHPLVRAYFAKVLEKYRPAAWRECHRRLYEHLCRAAPERPETLGAMQPLYRAVVHGCRAGLHQEALEEVYWRRIQRENEDFSTKKLGAIGTELTALAAFFEHPWNRPSPSLAAKDQAYVLNEAVFRLGSLGRLTEAVHPMEMGLERSIERNDWVNAARQADNLSELTLALGDVERALDLAEQSVLLADLSEDPFQRRARRTTLADVLHQGGHWNKSAAVFRKAEEIQELHQPRRPRLYSLQGHQYCDLLISLSEAEDGSGLDRLAADPKALLRFRSACMEVLERASQALKIADWNQWLLDTALDHLSLGRAYFGLATTAPIVASPGEQNDLAEAADHLDRAVDGFRRAGQENYLPRGLLARAAFHRFRSANEEAATDLGEMTEIAERGSMRLFLCDAHLEWARLRLQQGDAEGARLHIAEARELVNATGYGRREREVAYLERLLPARPMTIKQSAEPEPVAPVPPPQVPVPVRPTVFISYSHIDESWKNRLFRHLEVLEQAGILEVWMDRKIETGDDWLPEITAAMERAKIAVLLVSADLLSSPFICGTEVPGLLARRRTGGLHLLPVLIHPCPWQAVDWLATIEFHPHGRVLSEGSEHQIESDLASLALEIRKLLV